MVSIIIPNYNNTKYLEEMVECVKRQSYSKWELIIVDDQSTDNSYEYASALAEKDNRIKVLQRNREPKGGQTCRNEGLYAANGEYVIFLDSDDLIADYCLEQRVKFMEENPEIDFAIFPAHSFKPREDYITLYPKDVVWGKGTNKDVIDLFLRNEYPFLVVTNIYKRSSLREMKWDENLCVRQDFDFNLSTLFGGLKYKFSGAEQYDYFYRGAFGQNNVSKNMASPKKYEGMVYLFDKIIAKLRRLDKKNETNYKNALKRYIVHYHNTLVVSGNKSLCEEYTDHFRKEFDKWYIKRLYFIGWVATSVNNSKARFVLSYILYLVLFGYKYYFVLMKKGIQKIIY